MIMLKRYILGLATLVMFFLMTPIASADKPHYTITTDATYAPFTFQDKNNRYVGIEQDMMKAIAEREGFTYTMKPMSFNSAAQLVSNGQADGIIAGMSITPERRQVYDFSTPYYKTGVAWIVKKGSKIKSLADLKGQTVALKTGTAASEYGLSLQKKYGFQVKYFNDTDTMYNDVAVGNSAATFEDMPVIQYAIKNGMALKVMNPDQPGNAGSYGFAVEKGKNKALLAAFNRGFAAIKKDGTYDKIVAKYLGARQATFSGTKSDNSTVLGILRTNKTALLNGLWQTIVLTVIAIIFASIWGILLGIMGVSQFSWVRGIATTIIYIFRGLPLMVLAFFIYIGLPGLTGVKIPAFTAGIITLILNEGAYTGAFVRGGFEAVNRGQMEAARSLGLSYSQAMRRVIMPQGLRIMVPSFINQFIITLKDTSILSAIGLLELTQTGSLIVARNSQGFRVWAIIGVMYLILITLLTWFSRWVEKRMTVK